MAKKRTAKHSGSKAPARHRRRLLGLAAGLLLVVAAYGIYVKIAIRPEEGLSDVFRLLEEQGYTPNVGLSDLYQPGTVIQTMESGPDGEERRLASPLPFLWGSDCFPGLEPRESPFVLPESTGKAAASLSLGAESLARLVPALALDDDALVRYRLELENPRLLTVTRPEVSRNFSEACVKALSQTLADGDRMEWFSVIVQAVVADALHFEMQWQSDASAEARLELRNRARKALGSPSGKLGLTADDEKKTVLQADGLVVLAYRARPIALPEVADSSEPSQMVVTASEAPSDPQPGRVTGRLAIRLLEHGGSRHVGIDHRFRSGDHFRFDVVSSDNGWLYVLHRPPGGELDLLWPPEPAPGSSGSPNAVRAQKTYVVPRPPAFFHFDDEVGDEFFYVAIAAEPQAPAVAGGGEAPAVAGGRTRERVENFIVRGLHDTVDSSGRGVILDPGVEDADPWLYFSAPAEADGTVAAVEFQLRHAE